MKPFNNRHVTALRCDFDDSGIRPGYRIEVRRDRYPRGWNEARVRRVLEHYDQQTDSEAIAEDEAAYEATTTTSMKIPVKLVPAVRALLAKRRAS